MDEILWKYGQQVAASKGHARAWELDFLRGMHQGPALADLAQFLRLSTHRNIRLMSIWLDKHAWVYWQTRNGEHVRKRELADLAVIVRKPVGSGIARWMWLIQGKRTNQLLDTYSGISTACELDLLHRIPKFGIIGTNKTFNLKRDFPSRRSRTPHAAWGVPVSVPWTFMDFDADIQNPSSAYSSGYSPIAPRWPGQKPQPRSWATRWRRSHFASESSIASYTQCLHAIIQGRPLAWADPGATGKSPVIFVPGGPIDHAAFPVWSDLHDTLLRMSSNKISGHARTNSNPDGSILQRSEFAQSISGGITQPSNIYSPGDYWTIEYLEADSGFTSFHAHDAIGVAVSGASSWQLHDKIAAFDHLAHEEQRPSRPSSARPPPHDFPEGDEHGGMMTLFIDVLGE